MSDKTEDGEIRPQIFFAIEKHTVYSQDDPQDLEVIIKVVDQIMPLITTKAEQLAAEREKKARIDELKSVLKNCPMPTLSYEDIENRITTLNKEAPNV